MKITSLSPFGKLLTFDQGNLKEVSSAMLLEVLREDSLLLIRGLSQPERDQFLKFCQSFAGFKTLDWSFGSVMEMKESDNPQNYLFSREAVPFHWDGAFHKVPDYLVFSCVEAPLHDCGGETLFTNTQLIWESLTSDQQRKFKTVMLEYTTEKLAHYGGQICNPLVAEHPTNSKSILHFAEEVKTQLNPVTLKAISSLGDHEVSEILKFLKEVIYSPKFCLTHQWQSGDLLIADNHSLIHGRNAFKEHCPRHLRRIQLIRDEAA